MVQERFTKMMPVIKWKLSGALALLLCFLSYRAQAQGTVYVAKSDYKAKCPEGKFKCFASGKSCPIRKADSKTNLESSIIVFDKNAGSGGGSGALILLLDDSIRRHLNENSDKDSELFLRDLKESGGTGLLGILIDSNLMPGGDPGGLIVLIDSLRASGSGGGLVELIDSSMKPSDMIDVLNDVIDLTAKYATTGVPCALVRNCVDKSDFRIILLPPEGKDPNVAELFSTVDPNKCTKELFDDTYCLNADLVILPESWEKAAKNCG